MNFSSRQSSSPVRRKILFFGSLLLLWPLLRFLSHKVPRKPRVIEAAGSFQNKSFLTKEEFIVFHEDEQLWAVSRNCTHLGCRLNYIEKEQHLECPCHQSRFSRRGDVLKGPAEKPLPRYPVERTDTPTTFLITIS